jgi:hypothetical protein
MSRTPFVCGGCGLVSAVFLCMRAQKMDKRQLQLTVRQTYYIDTICGVLRHALSRDSR